MAPGTHRPYVRATVDPRISAALADRYLVDREIGRGGMATVYLARDVRHSRPVALKVLNPELGAVLGVERFLAEIQVTANLQHPNLLPLFDSGEVAGHLFYVMPFVEGETLRARLEREKQLPVDEAVRIAQSIAGALDYAHRHHVIHRDLKPENVLMHEGQPLIADFGIALAVSNAGGARITQTGLSLGTPQYMSPEQATGDRVVDGRTDIYSLGAMTYEMLVGDPPHVASTAQAIIAKVLTERPTAIRATRSSVPIHVDLAVSRALSKLAADRFATAKAFADALDRDGAFARSTGAAHGAGGGMRLQRRELVAWSSTAALGVVALTLLLTRPEPAPPTVLRRALDLTEDMQVADAVSGTSLAVSPDGRMIAFTSVSVDGYKLYLRRADELAPRELADVGARNLAFSPNGEWIAFTEGNTLMKVATAGGRTIALASVGAVPYGIAWGANDTIYVGGFSGMGAVPAGGGPESPVGPASADGVRYGQRWPVVIADGRALAFARGSGATSIHYLTVLDLRTNTLHEFEQPAVAPLGMIDDRLIFVSPVGTLMAVKFDASRSALVGDAMPLDEDVLVDATAGAKATLSASGTLSYLMGRADYEPALLPPSGGLAVPLLPRPGPYTNPRYSPNERQVALTVSGPGSSDIHVFDIGLNTLTRLTTEGINTNAEWSPDGRFVLFVSIRDGKAGIWRQPADGSGPAELLFQPEQAPFEAIMSPDGKWLVFRTTPGAVHSRDILAVPMTGEKTVREIVVSPRTESEPRISPDSRWLAYQGNESGRFEVYVRPFPDRGARVQVSDAGGTEPVWGRDGRSLYYRDQRGNVVRVSVTIGTSFGVRERRTIPASGYLISATHASYDVRSDGRFLMVRRAGEESRPIIVHNWASEVRSRLRTR